MGVSNNRARNYAAHYDKFHGFKPRSVLKGRSLPRAADLRNTSASSSATSAARGAVAAYRPGSP